jgi:hypothetical protein
MAGVNIEKPTRPGQPLTITFLAKDRGIYEVQAHDSGPAAAPARGALSQRTTQAFSSARVPVPAAVTLCAGRFRTSCAGSTQLRGGLSTAWQSTTGTEPFCGTGDGREPSWQHAARGGLAASRRRAGVDKGSATGAALGRATGAREWPRARQRRLRRGTVPSRERRPHTQQRLTRLHQQRPPRQRPAPADGIGR